MTTLRWYVIGPILGEKDAASRFEYAKSLLESEGHQVRVPVITVVGSRAECMRASIAALLAVDVVYALEGSASSAGASEELFVASVIGLPVRHEHAQERRAAREWARNSHGI